MKPDPKRFNGATDAHLSDATGFVDSTITLAERLLELGIESALIMDGYDDCAIGVLERFGTEPVVLYDKELVIQQLMDDGIPTYEEALEYYEFNQLGGFHGDQTPGFLVWLPKL